jgi:hypothetical protein
VTTLQPQERSSPRVASRTRGSSSITTTSLGDGCIAGRFHDERLIEENRIILTRSSRKQSDQTYRAAGAFSPPRTIYAPYLRRFVPGLEFISSSVQPTPGRLAAADAFRPSPISTAGHMNARSFLAWPYTGFPDRRSRPFRINVVITPAVHERTDVNPMLSWASPFSRCREPRQPVWPKRPGGFGARLSVADDVPILSIRRNSAF